MKALLQRVLSAQVEVSGSTVSSIGPGLLVFLGVVKGDDEEQATWLAQKILRHRVFPDSSRPMNRSVVETNGDLLVVSQFTLCASSARGNRPDFSSAERPERAEQLYDYFVQKLRESNLSVSVGRFGADMHVSLVNDGPVTILLNRDRDRPD